MPVKNTKLLVGGIISVFNRKVNDTLIYDEGISDEYTGRT
jgi:hypothetical protein